LNQINLINSNPFGTLNQTILLTWPHC